MTFDPNTATPDEVRAECRRWTRYFLSPEGIRLQMESMARLDDLFRTPEQVADALGLPFWFYRVMRDELEDRAMQRLADEG